MSQPHILPLPRPCFPLLLTQTKQWSLQNKISLPEAEDRFIQYAALDSLLRSSRFRNKIVIRGAAAMRLFYGLQRSTDDLDLLDLSFSAATTAEDHRDAESAIDAALSAGMGRHFGTAAEHWLPRLLARVEVQMSPVRSLLRFEQVRLGADELTVGVADLHFLISEKIAALLTTNWGQRKKRNHDLTDIAEMLIRHRGSVSAARVNEYFAARVAIEPRLGTVRFDDQLRRRVAATCDVFVIGRTQTATDFKRDWPVVVALAKEMGLY